MYNFIMADQERVTIFGDIRGIKPVDIGKFVQDAKTAIGGSHPSVTPEERARQILQECTALMQRRGPVHVWVVDSDPQGFLSGLNAGGRVANLPAVLGSMTLVKLSSPLFSDRRDSNTGVRVVHLPPNPYHFSTHGID